MLAEEITTGIYPDGKLTDVFIEPDGHEYHLYITGYKNENGDYITPEHPKSVGSIVFVNNDWVYEGNGLAQEFQAELAELIKNY